MIHPHSISAHDFEDLKLLRTCLLAWYKSNARALPWRKSFVAPPVVSMSHEERIQSLQRAYEVFVSEMMLQQTQVATVIPYFNRWMKRFPTLDVLAAANLEEVRALWAGLGYYARARRLQEAAVYLLALERQKEMIPTDVESWIKNVPGCGEYTAGAVLSIAWNIRCPLVDGNVIRVLSRLRAVGVDCRKGEGKRWVWEAASQLVDDQHPGDFNQALMELGAMVCTPANPNCEICPLNKDCFALKEAKTVVAGKIIFNDLEHKCDLCPIEELGQFVSIKTYITERYPKKVPKKPPRLRESMVFVIVKEENTIKEYYLEKRPPKGLLAGLWDFKTLILDENSKEEMQNAEKYAKEMIILGEIIEFREKGNTLHQFTHIKQISYVYSVTVSVNAKILGEGYWMSEEIMKNQSIPELTWKNFRQATSSEKRVSNMKNKSTKKRLKVNNDGFKQTTLFF